MFSDTQILTRCYLCSPSGSVLSLVLTSSDASRISPAFKMILCMSFYHGTKSTEDNTNLKSGKDLLRSLLVTVNRSHKQKNQGLQIRALSL